MEQQDQLKQLLEEYETTRAQLIEAVGVSEEKENIEQLKRQLEVIASRIRKIDVNLKF